MTTANGMTIGEALAAVSRGEFIPDDVAEKYRISQHPSFSGPFIAKVPTYQESGEWVVANAIRYVAEVNNANGNAKSLATLFAASPALLAALHRMLECHQAAMDAADIRASRSGKPRQCRCGACDEARAAVAMVEVR